MGTRVALPERLRFRHALADIVEKNILKRLIK
jgi:hypothetical protein